MYIWAIYEYLDTYTMKIPQNYSIKVNSTFF